MKTYLQDGISMTSLKALNSEKPDLIIVPPVKSAWCFHDDGIMNLDTYYQTRLIFMKEYADMLH